MSAYKETHNKIENKEISSGTDDIKEEAKIEKAKSHSPEYKTFLPGDDVYNQNIDLQDVINSKAVNEKSNEVNKKQSDK